MIRKNNTLLLMAVGTLIAVGLVFVLIKGLSNNSTENQSFSDLSGNYFDVIAQRKALRCEWRVPENLANEFQIREGEFYTDGANRGRSDATYKGDGDSFAVRSIINDQSVFTWVELPNGESAAGYEISRSRLETVSGELSPVEELKAQEIRAHYSFNCQPWAVDESKFLAPENVIFSKIN